MSSLPGASVVSQRAPPSISTTAQPVPAAPPSRAEIERKLSVKSPVARDTAPQRSRSKPIRKPTSGNESDSSAASSSLPPLIINTPTSVFGGPQFTNSPIATSPATPHGGLSAIAERHGSSIDSPDLPPVLPDAPAAAVQAAEDVDEDDTDEDVGDNADLQSGMDGQRVVKSGFLIKKQERRKMWKKKWFVLRSTKVAYYKDNREYSLSRAIDLQQIHSVVPVTSEKQKHPFAFALVTAERTFFVEALSAEERADWISAINSTRKRLSDKQEDAARKNQAQAHAAQAQSRPVPVPAGPGRTAEEEQHVGTWTSNFSGISASPSVAGSYMNRGPPSGAPASLAPSYAPSSYNPPSSSQQTQASPAQNSLSGQMASLSARSPTVQPPSKAAVNRRLSNPIIQPLQMPTRQGTTGLRRDASTASNEGLSAMPHSSDEDEPYFSDPSAAWSDMHASAAQQQQTQQQCANLADPNKVILAMYLMKKSRKTAREVWRKRWFFLTSSGITYTKSHMDARVLTFIALPSILDVFSVEEASEDDGGSSTDEAPTRKPSTRSKSATREHAKTQEHMIRIVTNKRRFDLCAPSEEEEIKWIAAIRALINRERERQTPSSAAPLSPRADTSALPPAKTVPAITQTSATPSSIATITPGGDYFASTAAPASPTHERQAQSFQNQSFQVHGRKRSATATAKSAVADVVRRFQLEGQ